MSVLFISDLHLDDVRPDVVDLFARFTRSEAAAASALYILGDLFESWIGDDDPRPVGAAVTRALAALTGRGVPVRLMRGNRDFLLGHGFAAASGCQLLPDPCVIDLFGTPAVLTHGDALCTGDSDYQAFRQQVRQPGWQREFLNQPLAQRLAFAEQARAASKAHQMQASADAMDVSPAAVDALLIGLGIDRLIHGHTHRPAIHRYPPGSTVPEEANSQSGFRERIVLGDWYTQGSVLRVSARDSFSLETLPE